MLTAARQALLELGVLSAGDPLPAFTARMSGNLVLLFYLDDARFYLVKVAIQIPLDREYLGLSMAYPAATAADRGGHEPAREGNRDVPCRHRACFQKTGVWGKHRHVATGDTGG